MKKGWATICCIRYFFVKHSEREILELQIHSFLPASEGSIYSRYLQLWRKLKMVDWVAKSAVFLQPHYCRLTEAL